MSEPNRAWASPRRAVRNGRPRRRRSVSHTFKRLEYAGAGLGMVWIFGRPIRVLFGRRASALCRYLYSGRAFRYVLHLARNRELLMAFLGRRFQKRKRWRHRAEESSVVGLCARRGRGTWDGDRFYTRSVRVEPAANGPAARTQSLPTTRGSPSTISGRVPFHSLRTMQT